MIPVLTTREPHVILWKPFSEVVDVIYNYAVTNKKVGFKYDW